MFESISILIDVVVTMWVVIALMLAATVVVGVAVGVPTLLLGAAYDIIKSKVKG